MSRLVFSISLLSLFAGSAPAKEKLRFNRDIRPILSDACFHCHGPDEKERKGGLRLDLADQAFLPGKSGLVPITPGNPGESEILVRIFLESDDSDFMPPPESGKSLTPAQRDTLKRWIEEGAEYEGDWAFEKPERTPLPAG